MKKLLLFSSLWAIIFTGAYAQDPASAAYQKIEVPNIAPLAPNAASLGQYGQIPIGHYTGIPSISIPLYEIDMGDKVIPIGLSYHASGVKVAQEASSVGLSWVLNAGGCISREIRHYDDFESTSWLSSDGYSRACLGYYFNDPNSTSFPFNQVTHLKYLDNKIDSEPDIFHINMGVISGSFSFNRHNKGKNTTTLAQTTFGEGSDYLDVKFKFARNGGWEITDSKGYKYYFKSCDTTTVYSRGYDSYKDLSSVRREQIPIRGVQPHVKTAWYIDEIITPKNDTLKFTYDYEIIYTPISIGEDLSYFRSFSKSAPGGYETFEGNLILFKGRYVNYFYSYSINKQQLLRSVKFKGGEIILNYTHRDDIEPFYLDKGAHKISSIIIKDDNSNIIKQIELEQSYIGSPKDYNNCRLILDGVNIIDPSLNSAPQKYRFDYNRNPLLPKNSTNTDHWGYCNSTVPWSLNPNNSFLFTPSVLVIGYDEYHKECCEYLRGRSKSPEEGLTQNGILKSITYPTGGKTLFEYEQNEFSNSLFELKEIDLPQQVTLTNLYSDEFYIDDLFVSALLLDFQVVNMYENSIQFKVQVEKKSGGTYSVLNEYTINRNKDEGPVGTIDNISLAPGTYRVKLNPLNAKCFQINIIPKIVKPVALNRGGGLRVKRIADMLNDTDTTTVKTYKYEKDGVSSGLIMACPHYHYSYYIASRSWPVSSGNCVLTDNNFINGSSSSSNPLTPNSGRTIGYSYVEERQTASNSDNGYTAYTFKNQVETVPGGFYSSTVVDMPLQLNYDNGLAIDITHYNSDNLPVKKQTFQYDIIHRDTLIGGKYFCPTPGYELSPQDQSNSFAEAFERRPYNSSNYTLYIDRWVMTKTTETNYMKDSGAVEKTFDYGYNSLITLKNYEKTNINGDILETHIKYPVDYSDAISNGMKGCNMVGIPVETISTFNGDVIEAQKIRFDNVRGMYLPTEVYLLDSSIPVAINTYQHKYLKVLDYDQYDDNGNITQYTLRGNTPIVYLWSYVGKYPIAEIKNATYSQVVNAMGANAIQDLNKAAFPTDKQIMSVFVSLRDKLPNSQITSYTYKPLTGVTSITDPSGRTTYYEYDGHGRLATIKDDKDMLHKTYNYNYKGQ